MNSPRDIGILILRITLSILLMFHGIHKIFNGIGFIENKLAESGLPEFIAYGVYIGEVVAPLLLLIGYKSRLSAGVIFFNMIMAIYLVYPAQINELTDTGAWTVENPAFFMLVALALIFTGGGKFAVSSRKWGD